MGSVMRWVGDYVSPSIKERVQVGRLAEAERTLDQ